MQWGVPNQVLKSAFFLESQRDSATKPRVARNEATLGKRRTKQQPQRGCDPRCTLSKAETPLGFCLSDSLPQGSTFLATLALGRNPFGIGIGRLLKSDLRPDQFGGCGKGFYLEMWKANLCSYVDGIFAGGVDQSPL